MRKTSRTAHWLAALILLTGAAAAEAGAPSQAFSVLLGGSSWDGGVDVAVDAAGTVWLAGSTASPDFPFPAGSTAQDLFIAHLSPEGALLSARPLGGQASDLVAAIALDAAGNLYVAGSTFSPDFPVTTSLALPGSTERVFVVKLDPQGAIVYSTVFGGTGGQHAMGLAVDGGGHAYVTGSTNSPDFPTAGAPFPTLAGQNDFFVTRLSADGASLLYSTYLGGSGFDAPYSIAVDVAGNAVVAGYTQSTDFPRLRSLPEHGSPGISEAVVVKLSPAGSLIYSTLLGGSVGDWAKAVAIDPAGNALVFGQTSSPDFPLQNASLPQPAGNPDGEPPFNTFLIRLSPEGSLLASTFFGGNSTDGATDLTIDSAGFISLLGFTGSSDFPLRDPLPMDATPSDIPQVIYVTRLNPQASEILFSTFLDGTEGAWGWAYGMTVDTAGNLFVAGETNDPNFPVIGPSQRTETEPNGDAFAVKIELSGNRAPDCSAAAAAPAVIVPATGSMVPVSVSGATDPDGDPVDLIFTAIHQDEPVAGGGPDATGVGTATANVRSTRAGQGDGRVYHLRFRGTDPGGLTCSGEVAVCVPLSQQSPVCGDGGATVDSTSPRPRNASLLWSTFLGGSGDEVKQAGVEIDASGHAWIAGTTASEDYPVLRGAPPNGYDDEYFFLDAFVSRLTPNGALERSGYSGEYYSDDFVEDLAIGPNGESWLAGWYDSYEDVEVIASRTPRGQNVGGSFRFFNGEGTDQAYAVTTDSGGNAYIAGSSGSSWFPGTGQYVEGGVGDYVLKLGPGTEILKLFLLQGQSGVSAVAVDGAGFLYVAGSGGDPEKIWVVKLDPAGATVWESRFGGSGEGAVTSIAVDAAGRAWVAGWTDAPDFPVRGGRMPAGGRDAFLVRLTPGGALDVSTLLGGAGNDQAQDLALDAGGRPYLAGITTSADFPLSGPLAGSCGAGRVCGAGSDAFAAAFDLYASTNLVLTFSTRLGGGSSDEACGVAVTPAGTYLWVSGLTRSTDFQTFKPWQPALAGEGDAFVARIILGR